MAPKALVRPLAMRYIAGPVLDDALATIRRLSGAGRTATVDVLGEQLSGRDQSEALMGEYRRALDAFAGAGLEATLSVKMTGLGLSVDESLCAENVRSLVAAAGDEPLALRQHAADRAAALIEARQRLLVGHAQEPGIDGAECCHCPSARQGRCISCWKRSRFTTKGAHLAGSFRYCEGPRALCRPQLAL